MVRSWRQSGRDPLRWRLTPPDPLLPLISDSRMAISTDFSLRLSSVSMNETTIKTTNMGQSPAYLSRILSDPRARQNLRLLMYLRNRFPQLYAIHSAIASAFWNAGRSEDALATWRTLTKKFPQAPHPYFIRAMWALDMEKWRHAEESLRQCLRRDDGFFCETAHFWRAECLYRLECYASALQALEHVREDYCECHFLNYRTRSKRDLINDIRVCLT